MDTHIRKPLVAGFFYPDETQLLTRTIKNYLNKNKDNPLPKALIVPHANYTYIGSMLATAYASLSNRANQIKNVVLLGASHRIKFRGIAITSKLVYLTPLGQVPVNESVMMNLLKMPQIIMYDEAHIKEHSLEVQLPFLQTILQHFSLIPLVADETTVNNVNEILNLLWGNEETLVVITSNLSYYNNYNTAQQLDQEISQIIETLRWQDLKRNDICGAHLIGGLLKTAQQKSLKVKTLDLCNSGDTIGTKDRVVGYGTYAFYED